MKEINIILWDCDRQAGNRHGGDKILAGLQSVSNVQLFYMNSRSDFHEIIMPQLLSKIFDDAIEIDFFLHASENEVNEFITSIADKEISGKWALSVNSKSPFINILLYSGGGTPPLCNVDQGSWIYDIAYWHPNKNDPNLAKKISSLYADPLPSDSKRFTRLKKSDVPTLPQSLLGIKILLEFYLAVHAPKTLGVQGFDVVKNKGEFINLFNRNQSPCLFDPINIKDSLFSDVLHEAIEASPIAAQSEPKKARVRQKYYLQESGESAKKLALGILGKSPDKSNNWDGALRLCWELIEKSGKAYDLDYTDTIDTQEKKMLCELFAGAYHEIVDLQTLLSGKDLQWKVSDTNN